MSRYAIKPHDSWIEVFPEGMVVGKDGIAVSRATLDQWSYDECLTFGVARVPEPPLPPEGHFETGRYLAEENGGPIWVIMLQTRLPPPDTGPVVPSNVTNMQARAVMRQYRMPDDRSLFATVDEDFRQAVKDTADLDTFDPVRIAADINWQAWEQANAYDREGLMVQGLAAKYDLSKEVVDGLFIAAEQVRV